MVVFEAIRSLKGGGTLVACHKDLKPKLVEEYEDEFELLVVEIEVKKKQIRVISGYGPQENWKEEKRMNFFTALETEIEKTMLAGKSIIVEMDANSKLGSKYISEDPHEMSPNGAILAAIVERQHLIVVNGSTTCKGAITRRRTTKRRIEESIIDIVLVSSDMMENLVEMKIDEDRKYVLTKVTQTKKGIKLQSSDHNTILTEFNLKLNSDQDAQKIELYNLKNVECQEKFKAYTSNTNMLSSIFDSKEDIDILTERFLKKLNGCISRSFKKIRISKKDDKGDDAKKNFEIVKAEVKNMKPNENGMTSKKLWKLKKKLCPNSRPPPTAMLDSRGNLLTADQAIEERALEVFEDRLKGNEMEDSLKDLESDTNKLCDLRLKLSKTKKTKAWDIEDLKFAIKGLKKNKSRDADGYANELFAITVAGDDLLLAVLKLLNCIKDRQQFPKAFENCNITPLHKNKSKNDFENYRGVFRVSVLRSIMDRLLYIDSYETIDDNLTDANVGARKERSVRDNMFVISAVTNSVLNGISRPIQVEVMDVIKCYDKLWLEACINSLYEAGLNNDHLNLLYLENKTANIAVKINNKVSRRIPVKRVVMQGSVWGGLKCTTQMDTLNKYMKAKEELTYKYRGDPTIPIGVLGMVDDTLAIAECGVKSVEKNAVVNSFMETHRLKMHKDKSVVIHVSKAKQCSLPCPKLMVHKDKMHEVDKAKYLGNYLSSTGGVKATIEDRRNKGWGKVSQILGILGEVDLGRHRMEAGLILRKAILTNSLLFSAEAWSDVTDKDVKRLEQVDSSLLKSLVKGHSKTPVVFHHLESGTIMLRHMLMVNRLMYHHHLLSRGEEETIYKIYCKQKEDPLKGDWFNILKKDFEFIGIELNETDIINTPKSEYRIKIKKLVEKAAFDFMIKEKNGLSKIKNIKYESLKIQDYLKSEKFGPKERNLLYALRSRSHPAKMNYQKLNSSNLMCTLGCQKIEDQNHIFEKCSVLNTKEEQIRINFIFEETSRQKEAIVKILRIEKERIKLKEALKSHPVESQPVL